MSLCINCIAVSFFWRLRAKYMVLFVVYEKVRHVFPYFSKTVRHVNEASIQRKWRKLFKAFAVVKSLVISDCDMDMIKSYESWGGDSAHEMGGDARRVA